MFGRGEVISGRGEDGGTRLKAFSDDAYAWQLFRSLRWTEDICCLYCGCGRIKHHSRRGGGVHYYRCKACGKNFTDATGTIFHRLRIPLSKVLHFTHLLSQGTSVNKIRKNLSIAKSAAFRLSKKLRGSPWYSDLAKLVEKELLAANATRAVRVR